MAYSTRSMGKGEVANLYATGMDIDRQDRGDFIQNFYFQNGAMNVREGFGQVTRITSTMTTLDNIETNSERGFRTCLGTKYLNTDFGHEQILSVFKTVAWTSDRATASLSSTRNLYSVIIYDITTDEKREWVLFEHTAAVLSENIPLFGLHAHYETTATVDRQEWTEGVEEQVFFTEWSDRLFFGSKTMGVWFYTPTIFDGLARNVEATVARSFDEVGQHESTFRAEDTIISPVVFTENKIFSGESVNEDGSLSKLFTYATSSDITEIVDATTWYGRVVYAGGRTVWFSDVNKPNSVSSSNFITLDSENEITSIQALRDSILIWTTDETYVYLPNNDAYIVSGGRLYELSKHIGCLNNQAKVRVGDSCYWFDTNGIWANNGQVGITKLSDSIDPFFNTEVSRPLTNWYTGAGGDRGDGQSINLKTNGYKFTHVIYEPENERSFFVLPEQNFAWVLDKGGWKLWTWQTIANNDTLGSIEFTENILSPRLTADGKGGLYLIGGMDSAPSSFENGRGTVIIDQGAFYILKWERGGGLDRSSIPAEDKVKVRGEYSLVRDAPADTEGKPRFIIDKPIPVPVGTPIYSPATGVPPNLEYEAEEGTFLLPIRFRPSQDLTQGQISTLELNVNFDNTNFEFIRDGQLLPNQVLAIFPTERVSTWYAWYNNGGQITALGNNLHLIWRGDAAANFAHAPWSYPDGVGGGYMNMPPRQVNTLCYLVAKKIGVANDPAFTLVATPGWSNNLTGGYDCDCLIWRDNAYDNNTLTQDEEAQPVEWVYKTIQVGAGEVQIKSRGVSIQTVSTGNSSNPLFINWLYGLYNTLLGSDFKDWATQVVDVVDPTGSSAQNLQNNKLIRNLETTIPRLRESIGQATTQNEFDNAEAKWASLPDGSDGTVLVSNKAVNNITQSDSVRGGRLSYMLFGFIKNAAEKMNISSVKAIVRAVGAPRRKP